MMTFYLAQVLVTSLGLQPCPAQRLYSARALHRARNALQLRLFEARRARLDAARAVILGHSSVDTILALPDDLALLQGSEGSRLKHSAPKGATSNNGCR
jgi:hypothetical protein